MPARANARVSRRLYQGDRFCGVNRNNDHCGLAEKSVAGSFHHSSQRQFGDTPLRPPNSLASAALHHDIGLVIPGSRD
jgi:hypothetical protein